MNTAKARIKIFKSMIKLLETETFEAITIKQICAESGIHRSTFYAHFEDKYYLFNTMKSFHMAKYHRLMRGLTQVVQTSDLEMIKSKLLKAFKLIFRYIKRYQAFFSAVMVAQPQVDLIRDYVSATKTTYQAMLEHLPNLRNTDYFIHYTIGGQLSIIYTWLSRGCVESVSEMAHILYTNILKVDR
ncbi:TetR/AcrR family transcriptional regulator [Staphylococcus canis]|uniref:TetR/AcrR family transcriptional regulator n=1 Tax=Staphylococcus canis TaxID=2724942 RepID=A0ABS0T8L1_9STAP|nr:TetR/AcrR family transcriptional regulator [Staphylococcus canis]MBI5975098.1 TetR/AcrR family transcriptional regulator [Staphylococcus canis]